MHLGRHLVSLFAAGLLVAGLISPASAADPAPTTLSLRGAAAHADTDTTLRLDLVQEDGTPVPGAQVVVERQGQDNWAPLATVTTDDVGHAELAATLSRDPHDNVFRASYAGDEVHAPAETGEVPVGLVRRSSVVHLRGPDSVVDEQRVTLHVRWRTGNGEPVAGPVRILRRVGHGGWSVERKLRTGDDGRASFTTRPRRDTRWRAEVRREPWLRADASRVHRIDNLPPGKRVKLPGRAPHPRIHLPAQPHAVGSGPHAVIRPVPGRVWRQMTGVTWHRGCPVGRAQLRYVRINYWDYRGYRRRGEFVANADAAHRIAGALADLYRHKLPIRAMYRVDRFGHSRKLRGGNDYRSMASGNTSVFNCRDVVNKPGVRSPHSYGRALDLNTWENPYRSSRGTVPDRWWQPRSHPRVAWRARRHQVVSLMARHGLRWTYGLGDTQHFDAVAGNGRYAARPMACDGVCE